MHPTSYLIGDKVQLPDGSKATVSALDGPSFIGIANPLPTERHPFIWWPVRNITLISRATPPAPEAPVFVRPVARPVPADYQPAFA